MVKQSEVLEGHENCSAKMTEMDLKQQSPTAKSGPFVH